MSKTIKLKGKSANNFVAVAQAAGCRTQAQADDALKNCSGPYREALIAALKERGFTVQEA